MPASTWAVTAYLNQQLILQQEVRVPGFDLPQEWMDSICIGVYDMACCRAAPAGAKLDIYLERLQTPWWWE